MSRQITDLKIAVTSRTLHSYVHGMWKKEKKNMLRTLTILRFVEPHFATADLNVNYEGK
jgi:hypothetical protein